MEIISDIFAGLGLFFIGVRGIGSNMKQMTGRRFRGMVAKATGHPFSSAIIGIFAGILTQSSNAVTFIVVSMVTSGLTNLRRSIPIVAWSNVGTSLLVFMATLDIHFMVLYLLGVVGFCHYLGLTDDDRFRHVLGALYGVGTLFLGLWLIKMGALPLKDLDWVHAFIRFSEGSLTIPFIAGVALTLLIQSSSMMSSLAVTMTSAGILNLDQTLMIVLGSNLGSGFGTYLLAGNLTATGRQLALTQLLVKSLGVLILLPALLIEVIAQVPGLMAFIDSFGADLPHKVALVFLLLQLLSALGSAIFGGALETFVVKVCPQSAMENLAKPVYLYDQALEEGETALDLVEKEQARLVHLLPRLLDELRPDEVEGTPYVGKELYQACASIGGECQRFIDRLMGLPQSHATLERIMAAHSRNELLFHLQEGTNTLLQELRSGFLEAEAEALRGSLVEGLVTILMILDDAVEASSQDHQLLLTLTSDREGVMKNLREGIARSQGSLGVESCRRLLAATSLLERLIWLIHRFALLLKSESDGDQRDHSIEDVVIDSP